MWRKPDTHPVPQLNCGGSVVCKPGLGCRPGDLHSPKRVGASTVGHKSGQYVLFLGAEELLQQQALLVLPLLLSLQL